MFVLYILILKFLEGSRNTNTVTTTATTTTTNNNNNNNNNNNKQLIYSTKDSWCY